MSSQRSGPVRTTDCTRSSCRLLQNGFCRPSQPRDPTQVESGQRACGPAPVRAHRRSTVRVPPSSHSSYAQGHARPERAGRTFPRPGPEGLSSSHPRGGPAPRPTSPGALPNLSINGFHTSPQSRDPPLGRLRPRDARAGRSPPPLGGRPPFPTIHPLGRPMADAHAERAARTIPRGGNRECRASTPPQRDVRRLPEWSPLSPPGALYAAPSRDPTCVVSRRGNVRPARHPPPAPSSVGRDSQHLHTSAGGKARGC
jgi:hypothetical protein